MISTINKCLEQPESQTNDTIAAPNQEERFTTLVALLVGQLATAREDLCTTLSKLPQSLAIAAYVPLWEERFGGKRDRVLREHLLAGREQLVKALDDLGAEATQSRAYNSIRSAKLLHQAQKTFETVEWPGDKLSHIGWLIIERGVAAVLREFTNEKLLTLLDTDYPVGRAARQELERKVIGYQLAFNEAFEGLEAHARTRAFHCADGAQFEDLGGVAIQGLQRALTKVEGGDFKKIISYLNIRIDGAVYDEFRRLSGADGHTRNAQDNRDLLKQASKLFTEKVGRGPDRTELSELLSPLKEEGSDLTESGIDSFCFASSAKVYLDNVRDSESAENENTLHEIVSDPLAQSPAHLLVSAATEKLLARIMESNVLNESERKVIALYYYEDMKLREIGELLRVTESRICQIHAAALEKIRSCIRQIPGLVDSIDGAERLFKEQVGVPVSAKGGQAASKQLEKALTEARVCPEDNIEVEDDAEKTPGIRGRLESRLQEVYLEQLRHMGMISMYVWSDFLSRLSNELQKVFIEASYCDITTCVRIIHDVFRDEFKTELASAPLVADKLEETKDFLLPFWHNRGENLWAIPRGLHLLADLDAALQEVNSSRRGYTVLETASESINRVLPGLGWKLLATHERDIRALLRDRHALRAPETFLINVIVGKPLTSSNTRLP